MHYAYPATLETGPDGRVTVYFDGLPGATWGGHASRSLVPRQGSPDHRPGNANWDGEPIPEPPPGNGRPIVETELSR